LTIIGNSKARGADNNQESKLGNNKLQKVSFRQLKFIKGNLIINYNRIIGNLQINENHVHVPVLDFPLLESVGGKLEMIFNPNLKVFKFGRLKKIGNLLDIERNFELMRFNMNPLQTIGLRCQDSSNNCCFLFIKENSKLTFTTFQQLSYIYSGVNISANSNLSSLNGLGRLSRVNSTLYFNDNPSLCAHNEVDIGIIQRIFKAHGLPPIIGIDRNVPIQNCRSNCPNVNCVSRCQDYDACNRYVHENP